MEFRFTAEQEEFRQEVRGFLREALPEGWRGVYPDSYFEDEYWGLIREFTARLVQRGWLTMAWPVEYGGKGLSVLDQMVYNEEQSYYRAPQRDLSTGVNLVAPTVMVHGSEEQRQALLPPIRAGEHVYCQGFSEPGSGSDLASLQCAAVADGDDYVVNGSKIWTSGAHRSNRCILLTRTDPEAPKHRGISVFLIPMDLPGITVRPIVNPLGVHYFNQVFFDDVRVPKHMMIGEENRGWYVAATTLDFERSGIAKFASGQRSIDELVELAGEMTANGGSVLPAALKNALAEAAIANHAGRMLAYRVGFMQSQGKIPNQEASASKLIGTEIAQRISQVGMRIMGLAGQVHQGIEVRRPGRLADRGVRERPLVHPPRRNVRGAAQHRGDARPRSAARLNRRGFRATTKKRSPPRAAR